MSPQPEEKTEAPAIATAPATAVQRLVTDPARRAECRKALIGKLEELLYAIEFEQTLMEKKAGPLGARHADLKAAFRAKESAWAALKPGKGRKDAQREKDVAAGLLTGHEVNEVIPFKNDLASLSGRLVENASKLASLKDYE